MAFDLASAKPVDDKPAFDLASAKPLDAKPPVEEPEKPDSTIGMDTFGGKVANIFGGGPDAIAATASGMVAGPLSHVAEMGAIPLHAAGLIKEEPKDVGADVRNSAYQPKTEVGRAVAEYNPLAVVGKGVNWLGDKTQAALDSPNAGPVRSALASGAGEAVRQAPNIIPGVVSGIRAFKAPEAGFAPPEGQIAPPPVKPAIDPKLDILRRAREADMPLKVKPAQISDSPLASFMQGIGGDAKTGQLVATKNQPVAQAAARKALNLEADEPLNPYTFNRLRSDASKKYEALKDIGEVKTGPEYSAALDKIEAEDQTANKAFPKGGKSPVSEMVEVLREPGFPADGAIAKIRQLRKDADKSFKTGDDTLGRAQKSAALALEDELDRNATAKYGEDNSLVKDFRDARKKIAMTYAVQAATDPAGQVTMAKFGRDLAKGKVLTGELKLMGEFANAFGKSAQNIKDVPPNFSGPDAMVGIIPALTHGDFRYLAAAAGRPALRQFMTSDMYQNRLAAPPGAGPSLPPGLAASLLAAPPQRQ